jgi:transposase-like protein
MHRTLTTQVGDLDLIPKLRAGSFLPSILEPRRRGECALTAVIIEAYISGVSTRLSGRRPACRKHLVDALVASLGCPHLPGGSTSRSRVVVVAMVVNADGRRELLGLKLGDSQSFWSEFLGHGGVPSLPAAALEKGLEH